MTGECGGAGRFGLDGREGEKQSSVLRTMVRNCTTHYWTLGWRIGWLTKEPTRRGLPSFGPEVTFIRPREMNCSEFALAMTHNKDKKKGCLSKISRNKRVRLYEPVNGPPCLLAVWAGNRNEDLQPLRLHPSRRQPSSPTPHPTPSPHLDAMAKI